MKKKIILSLIVAIVIASVLFTHFYEYTGSLVSQSAEDVESITIAKYPYDTNKIVLENKDEINKVFNILLQTSDIINNRHHSHESMQHDPKFTIDIKYIGGKEDHIFASPQTHYIVKRLSSKGDYRIGKNQMIWEYVLQ